MDALRIGMASAYAAERHHDFRVEADRNRHLAIAEAGRAGAMTRRLGTMMAIAGGVLIALGTRLQGKGATGCSVEPRGSLLPAR